MLNIEPALKTTKLEDGRGKRNCRCSRNKRWYRQEHQMRRQLTGTFLTLRD